MGVLVFVWFVIGGSSFEGADIDVFSCFNSLNCNSGFILTYLFFYFVEQKNLVCRSLYLSSLYVSLYLSSQLVQHFA